MRADYTPKRISVILHMCFLNDMSFLCFSVMAEYTLLIVSTLHLRYFFSCSHELPAASQLI